MTTPFELALTAFQLGESETFLKLEGIEAFSAAQLTLMAQTKRELYILTPDFEAERYNETGFADALSAFVRRSRYSDARILATSKNLIKLMMARRKRPKKRSLLAVNEHFEVFSNTASAASAGF